MKIGKYISELLFEHDFVILPEIGEFSTKYIPAKFIPELKKVESPSKVIAFNEGNKSGGGLLIEYIAKQEDIESVKGREFVMNFVSEMQNSLKSGKKVELERVGVFSMSEGGQINFEPDTSINYLSDSAGMQSVSEPARKSEEEAKTELDKVLEEANKKQVATPRKEDPVIKPVSEAKPVNQPEKAKAEPLPTAAKKAEVKKPAAKEPMRNEQKAGLPPAVKWVALTVVPLLIIIIVLALNFEFIFGDKSVVWTRDAQPAATTTPIERDTAEETDAPAAAPSDEMTDEASPATQTEAIDPTVAPPAPEAGRRVYYIIVGSFEEEHSAIILAEELRAQGARTADVFPINRLGFYRVSYGYYYDLNEAEQDLAKARETNPNSWILHR